MEKGGEESGEGEELMWVSVDQGRHRSGCSALAALCHLISRNMCWCVRIISSTSIRPHSHSSAQEPVGCSGGSCPPRPMSWASTNTGSELGCWWCQHTHSGGGPRGPLLTAAEKSGG